MGAVAVPLLDLHTADVLDVAAVVTGGKSIHILGWQRDCAIQAMHALGYSRDRMRQALAMTRNHLDNRAAELGCHVTADPEPDWLAVEFVCQGVSMPLTGVDRDEAIRRLAGMGRTCPQIALVLRSTAQVVRDRANRLGVKVTSSVVARPDTEILYRRRQPVAA